MYTTIVHAADLGRQAQNRLSEVLETGIEQGDGYYRLRHVQTLSTEAREMLAGELGCDINTLPEGFDPGQARLLVTDMDSTLINIECIDEIGDFLGVKPQVSAITEAAMRGEIDFPTSLTRRAALLDGVHESALSEIYTRRLQLNPGAERLLAGLRDRGVRVALVSGGFTFFTSRLKERLGLDYTLANTLEISQGHLTGRVLGDIVGAEAKAEYLLKLCHELKIAPAQAIAVGDGANDLRMMAEAGLSVAYHAKPKVRAQAATAINHGGLDKILDLLNG